MSATRERRLAFQIFDAALDVPPSQRDAFVDERCAGDVSLKNAVWKLLRVANLDASLTGTLVASPALVDDDRSGQVYGHFRLVEFLGAGGMGVVYRADRVDGVPQQVAIKILRGDYSALSSRSRFEGEVRLLARLEHPAIARLIDVGVQHGTAWIALELVRGKPIDEYCDDHALGVRARVALLAVLAEAVEVAHRLLVVHRDIKPTNVLVQQDGSPKLIDFGIGAALNAAGAVREPTTDVRCLFTPNYAAPEQVAGEPVTAGTDVFGLGALGYRLLCGRAPFADASSPVGYMLAISQREVAPASEVAKDGRRAADSTALRGDLDAILAKALVRDPAQRYATVNELLLDLRRYLAGLPVQARPPTLRYRAGKFVRRNALAVALCGLMLTSALVGATFFAIELAHVAQARGVAARRGEFLQQIMKSANPSGGKRDVTVAEVLDGAAAALGDDRGEDPIVRASMYELLAETNDGLGRYEASLHAVDQALVLLRANAGGARDVAAALVTRADALRESDRLADSQTALREAISLLQTNAGTSAEMAGAYDLLGLALKRDAREKEAESAYRSAIQLYRRTGTPPDGRIAYPLTNLSVLLGEEGRYGESNALALESVERFRRLHPPDEYGLLGAESNYAESLVNQRLFADAEPVLRRTAQERARIEGPDHRDTLGAQINLADDLNELGRYAEAAHVAWDAAQRLDRVSGPDDALTLAAWQVYGVASCETPQTAEGLAALTRVASARATRYGNGDWHTASTRVALGRCLVVLGRAAEAEPLLVSAVTALEAARGPGFHRTQAGYRILEDLYSRQGRDAEARRWQAKVQP